MAIKQQVSSRVYLNRLLSRHRSNVMKGKQWTTTTIQWAFPDQSLDLYTTTSTTVHEPDNQFLVPTTEIDFLWTTPPAELQADEPLRATTASQDPVPLTPTQTHCSVWTTQLSGLRVAVGLSVALSLLLALGLVYMFWLYHRLQHGSRDEELGNIPIYSNSHNTPIKYILQFHTYFSLYVSLPTNLS